jgi:hypothetical protein
MISFKKELKKIADLQKSAPLLVDISADSVATFTVDQEKWELKVKAFNDTALPQDRLPPLGILDLIDHDLKLQIMKETLPKNIPSLQDFYPSERRFWTPNQGQSATDKEILERAKRRALEILQEVKALMMKSMQDELTSLLVEPPVDVHDNTASSTAILSEASVVNHNAIETLRRNLRLMQSEETHHIINGKFEELRSYVPAPIRELFWDEELIRLFFRKIMYTTIRFGDVNFPDLVKQVQIDWTSRDKNRISSYMAKLNGILKKHSLQRIWESSNFSKQKRSGG